MIRELFEEVRISQNLTDQVDEAAADALGVNGTAVRCIDIIERHGRIAAGQLAEESGLTTGAVTTVLDRLEEAGYVRRIRDDVDRRRVFVELTEELRRRAWELWGPMEVAARKHATKHSTEQLAMLVDFLRTGHELSLQQIERIREHASAKATDAAPTS